MSHVSLESCVSAAEFPSKDEYIIARATGEKGIVGLSANSFSLLGITTGQFARYAGLLGDEGNGDEEPVEIPNLPAFFPEWEVRV